MSEVFVAQQTRAKKWKGQFVEYAHAKGDGWRCSFFRQRPEIGRPPMIAYGRDRSKKGEYREDLNFFDRFPRLHSHPVVRAMIENFPPRTMIDTEITVGHGVRSDVVTALKDESIPLNITAFAVPYFDGEDCRSGSLEWAAERASSAGVPFFQFHHLSMLLKVPTAELSPSRLKARFEEYAAVLMEAAEKSDMEGWVLKGRAHGLGWFKVKGVESVDCMVTGAIAGEGKYAGQVGSIQCSVKSGDKWVDICTCSGMTDSERAEITRMRDDGSLFGKIVEVKYQMVGAQRRLVHPRFVRFRDDRTQHDCTISQIEE